MESESCTEEPIEALMEEPGEEESSPLKYLEKFGLFETPDNFYIVGRNEQKTCWRVMKISRSDPSKLLIFEDPTIYSFGECKRLLQTLNEGNKLGGGLKLVTLFYGIVGFIRFLGPYYMILVTERREIGKIFGHSIYAVSDYRMIPVPRSAIWSFLDNFERESRYKKLLQLLDITKDFFFSYSYPIMCSLQKNLCKEESGQSSDRKMFVWNEFLTRKIRNHLKNTLWTVALVHGFFKQVKLSNLGKSFTLTLIARRSHHFAGTRFQKRGANKKGQAANDVEIEQIVCPEIRGELTYKVTSAVQNRGSIPLCWSQQHSWRNPKPAILISEGYNRSEVPELHFQHLRLRYGNPIILLSLVKMSERKPRESLLNVEFRKAVDCMNKGLCKDDQVQFLHRDLDAVFRAKGTDLLMDLKDIAAEALGKIKFFSSSIPRSISFKSSYDFSQVWASSSCACSLEAKSCDSIHHAHQKGIQRTNCIDSIDRTNFAQFVYGLVALGHQLDTLGMARSLELDHSLFFHLMAEYEVMGDSLALQYGGSAAHSKIFARCRGEWKLATKFWEFVKAIQRHFTNSFIDVHRQKAIDVFLGHIQPGVDGQYRFKTVIDQSLKRSQSDSKIYYETSSDTGLSSPESSSSESNRSYSRSSSESDLYSRNMPCTSFARLLFYVERHWFGDGNKFGLE